MRPAPAAVGPQPWPAVGLGHSPWDSTPEVPGHATRLLATPLFKTTTKAFAFGFQDGAASTAGITNKNRHNGRPPNLLPQCHKYINLSLLSSTKNAVHPN